jgi:soluble lytic murein transglycosylase-like protein
VTGSETEETAAGATENSAEQAAPAEQPPPPATGGIAPLFTREIQHWAPQIVAWSAEFGIDPNMAATVMQIESCGDPNAVSSAGAQGLFQVMPFHFAPGESMQDPDTNARRGLAYLALGMQQTSGDTSRSFAGYNGGHGTAARAWETWPAETQRYYVWSTGIYEDAVAGSATSETLSEWLAAGGAGLCQQAAARLGLQ